MNTNQRQAHSLEKIQKKNNLKSFARNIILAPSFNHKIADKHI
jgi:hypothetical protein